MHKKVYQNIKKDAREHPFFVNLKSIFSMTKDFRYKH